MSKSGYKIITRIGTCRSGIPFDMPYDIDLNTVDEYVRQFAINDQLDMFCMCEAKIVPIDKSDEIYADYEGIRVINAYFWRRRIFAALKPYLVDLGLQSSPDYVRFGQSMFTVQQQ
jgi:hypothetical protein